MIEELLQIKGELRDSFQPKGMKNLDVFLALRELSGQLVKSEKEF